MRKKLIKNLTNNLLYKIAAIIFAVILWLVVVNIDNPVVTRTISGIQVNILNDSAITNQDYTYSVVSGTTATVKVKGPRSILDNLEAADFVAAADFNEISMTNAVPIKIELSEKKEKYAGKIDIVEKTSSMLVNLESIQTQTYPVEIVYTGSPATSYIVGTQEISDTSVEVSAPNSILKKIKQVVVNVDITGKSADFSTSAQLLLLGEDGQTIELKSPISMSKTSVNVKVTMYKTKVIPVNFTTIGTTASGYEFMGLKYSPSTITIQGLEAAINNVEGIDIPASLIDISGASQNVTKEIDISSYLPEGITLVNESEKNISVTAQIQGPGQKSFTLTSTKIELRNIPEGYQATITTNPITVILSGNSSAVNAIQDGAIKGYIDLTGALEGSNDKTLTLLDLPSGVSAVSEIKVTVLLTKTAASETQEPSTTPAAH